MMILTIPIGRDVVQMGGVSGRFSERWPGAVCPVLGWRVHWIVEVSGAVSFQRGET